MADRRFAQLPRSHRLALRAELHAWKAELQAEGKSASQKALGDIVNVSGTAIGKAMADEPEIGPSTRDGILAVRNTTIEALLRKHGITESTESSAGPSRCGLSGAELQAALAKVDERYRDIAPAAAEILIHGREWSPGASWAALANVWLHEPPGGVDAIQLAEAAEVVLYGERGVELGRPLRQPEPEPPLGETSERRKTRAR